MFSLCETLKHRAFPHLVYGSWIQHSPRFAWNHGHGIIWRNQGRVCRLTMDEIFPWWMDDALFVTLLPSGVVRCFVLHGFVMDSSVFQIMDIFEVALWYSPLNGCKFFNSTMKHYI